jgi:hypothetical protein
MSLVRRVVGDGAVALRSTPQAMAAASQSLADGRGPGLKLYAVAGLRDRHDAVL